LREEAKRITLLEAKLMKTCTESERARLNLAVGKMLSSDTVDHKRFVEADVVRVGKDIVPNAYLRHDSERFRYKDHSELKGEWGWGNNER
jgi:hypothetical protein